MNPYATVQLKADLIFKKTPLNNNNPNKGRIP